MFHVKHFDGLIGDLNAQGLLRVPRVVCERPGSSVMIDGRRVLNLCSNDYLGLANHPYIERAMQEAVARWGTSASSSRLVTGTIQIFRDAEAAIAEYLGYQNALIFSTGYACNLGVIQAVASEGQLVLSDELNHASIVDGCRLSRADVRVYPHSDIDALERFLIDARSQERTTWIVTESVFSMDGDSADLQRIGALAARFKAGLIVDEAHAFGVIGSQTLSHLIGVVPDLITVTFGKAAGVAGAAVVGSSSVIRYIENRARSFVFSTAPTPAVPAGIMASLELLRDADELRERVRRNRFVLSSRLGMPSSDHPILPLVVGDPAKTIEISNEIFDRGVFAQAIRPPTVPQGTSRLRLVPTASHAEGEIEQAADVIREVFAHNGLRP